MPYLLIIAMSAATAFGAAWKVQDWRYGDQIAEIRIEQSEASARQAKAAAKAHAEAVQAAITEERAMVETVRQAEKEAREREQKSRVAAAAARRDADSLRDNLDALKSGLPGLTERAIRERAATLSGLLGDCAAEYQGMAATAQRHAGDVKLLLDAWPSLEIDQ